MKITSASHLDHNLTEAHRAWLLGQFGDRTAFFIATVSLPADLPALACGLHGPLVGDEPVPASECTLRVRGDRPGTSRMCARQT